ncbi:hypothetical protein EMIT051CA3_80354 [Pseudomonas chlororaphis]
MLITTFVLPYSALFYWIQSLVERYSFSVLYLQAVKCNKIFLPLKRLFEDSRDGIFRFFH